MNQEKLNQLAIELMRLGISQAGAAELMATSSIEEIERQLLFLPHRKAKRPGAFLIEAVRNKYSPPKEFYASNRTYAASPGDTLDEDTTGSGRPLDAEAERHGTASASSSSASDAVSEKCSEQAVDLVLPALDRKDWPPIRGD